MIYRQFHDKELPLLGFGTMRLPSLGGVYADIDEAEVEKMVAYAMEHGVNYFDTAWGYHAGNSETAIGKALAKYPRESYYLATKFPGYALSYFGKAEEVFQEQLQRCGVDYFDFYLLHNVCELNIDSYLDESFGTVAYLLKQKKEGRIRHLGFSAHGGLEVLRRFLDAYGEHMEFGQLQVNWIDWTFQDAREKVALLREHNIPVWVMEPLRGGMLGALPETDEAKLRALRPDESTPAWAFRFLQTIPEVTLILSGMSNLGQTKENIATCESEKPLTAEEMGVLQHIAEEMVNEAALPCTQCRYCVDHCPQGLDIPALIGALNQRRLTGDGDFIAKMALRALPADKKPDACTGCRSCEAVCPQQLDIADAMDELR